MPYRDPAKKREWEELHRAERLARRRELRQTKSVEHYHQPQQEAEKVEFGNSALLIPLVAGGALAAYSPKVGLAIGGLGLISSAVLKKGWAWWFVSVVILIVALFSYWQDRQDSEIGSFQPA